MVLSSLPWLLTQLCHSNPTDINPGVLPAAVKQRSPIQGTNCTADLIALHDPKSSTGFVRANPFGDGYAIDWSHRCAKAYVQSCANLLAIDYGIDFLKISQKDRRNGMGCPIGDCSG